MSKAKVLIINHRPTALAQLAASVPKEILIVKASNATEALQATERHQPSTILLDLGLPPEPSNPEAGLLLLQDLKACSPTSQIIVCTACGNRNHAAQAILLGAWNYLDFPPEHALLQTLIHHACTISELHKEAQAKTLQQDTGIQEMVGTSESIRRIFSAIRKISTNDYPVLITGESGTGKELTAKALHQRSPRKFGPFIPIHCGAIPESLLESELFGHEKGAFTGAHHQKRGKVEYAQRGTLFLDEIGDLPFSIQTKLLRFLQDRCIERVGGRETIQLDLRIIAATNVDLKQSIQVGTFRKDLYYRLGAMHIHLPPLRGRGEDVLLIGTMIFKSVCHQVTRSVKGFSREAIDSMLAYHWPGNIRELSNKVRRAVVMTEGQYLTPADLDLPVPDETSQPTLPYSLINIRQRLEGDIVAQALTLHGGNHSKAAKELGISRPTLYRLKRKHGLQNNPSFTHFDVDRRQLREGA